MKLLNDPFRRLRESQLRERQRGADNRLRDVVGAAGPRFARVQARPGGVEFEVSTPWTRKPGSTLPTGSHVSTSKEFGLTIPPPGERGSLDPLLRDVVLGGGELSEDCQPFAGFVEFKDLQVFSGVVELVLPDRALITSGQIANYDVTMVAFENGCLPSDALVQAEVLSSGSPTEIGTPDSRWLLSNPRVVDGGHGLRFNVAQVLSVVNPDGETWVADFRTFRYSDAGLETLTYYTAFDSVFDGLTWDPHFEI